MENNENMEKIMIAEATPEDAKGIQEVFYETWLDTYPNEEIGISAEDIKEKNKNGLTEEEIRRRAEKLEFPPDGQYFLVAKDNLRVVALCSIETLDKNQLQAIYVLPEYQGKGIGHLLWDEARKKFDPDKDIFVNVATYNKKTISFYEKLGFEDTGKRYSDEQYKMKSGAIIPTMDMVLKVEKF